MSIRKPIRVFFSVLTLRFYATRHYREIGHGVVECTGERFDVTNDIAGIIEDQQLSFEQLSEMAKEKTQ